MERIIKDRGPIEVPDSAYVSLTNRRVYIKQKTGSGVKTASVGQTADAEGRFMFPNRNFRVFYPEEWMALYPEGCTGTDLAAGVFVLVLDLVIRNGLYQILCDVLTPERAHSLLDCAVYSLLCRENGVSLENCMLFSGYSFDGGRMPLEQMPEGSAEEVARRWMEKCAEDGVAECWICSGGAGCSADSPACIWAVCTEGSRRGLPLCCCAAPYGPPDGSAWQKACRMAGEYGIQVRGYALDSGLCNRQTAEALQSSGCDFLLMLTPETYGFRQMMLQYGGRIPCSWEYLLESSRGMYGCTDRMGIFGDGDSSFVTLLWNSREFQESAETFQSRLKQVEIEAREAVSSGRPADLPADLSEYISIHETEEGTAEVRVDHEAVRRRTCESGFTAAASGRFHTPDEVCTLWRCCQTVWSLSGWLGKQPRSGGEDGGTAENVLVCLTAGIIEAELQSLLRSCSALSDLDMHTLLAQLQTVRFFCGAGGWHAGGTEDGRISALFADLGLLPEKLDRLASLAAAGPGRTGYCAAVLRGEKLPAAGRKRGPKKGSRRQTAGAEKPETPEGTGADGETEARTPEKSGSPQTAEAETPVIRKRGRKPGGTNRPKEEIELDFPKGHSGRPTRKERLAREKYRGLDPEEKRELLALNPAYDALIDMLVLTDAERAEKIREIRTQQNSSGGTDV